MADALTADSSQSCEIGSDDEDIDADESGISISDNDAASIDGVKQMPDHGDCPIWSAITVGSSTNCIAIIANAELVVGSLFVEYSNNSAGLDGDMYFCVLAGVITTSDGDSTVDIT